MYTVSYKASKMPRFVTWRLPVHTLEEARGLAKEIWDAEIDRNLSVSVKITNRKENGYAQTNQVPSNTERD